MGKFKLQSKKLSLEFLGEDWKECYLEFQPLTYGEIEKFVSLSFDTDNSEELIKSTDKVFEVLKDKYVGGYGVGTNGEKVKIDKSDLSDLPVEVVTKAINFLSVTEVPNA